MSNTLTEIVPKIIARTMIKLRKDAGIVPLVTRNYEADFKNKGDTVTIPIGVKTAAADVTPSMTFPTPSGGSMAKATIALDKWRGTNAQVSDDEVNKADLDSIFVPSQIEENIATLVDEVHDDIVGKYKGIYGIVGTAGTAPFGSNVDVLVDGHKTLSEQLCPRSERFGLIDMVASGNALKLAELREAQKSGDAKTLREAEIGRLLRFDMSDTLTMPKHTTTNLTAGAATINGVQAVGAGSTDGGRTGTISVAKATNTSPLVKGDIFEFTVGGVVQQHVVLADVTLAVGNTTVSVAPALRVATAGAEAVTLRATHRVNLLATPGAFALAVRPARGQFNGAIGAVAFEYTQPDPVTGLAIRVQIVRGYNMTAWYFDILFGSALVRPELACRLAG